MALIECRECGKKISDTAPSCPHCGYVMKYDRESKVYKEIQEKKHIQSSKISTSIIIIGICIILITILWVWSTYQSDFALRTRYYFGSGVTMDEWNSYKRRQSWQDVFGWSGIIILIIGIILKIRNRICSCK
jgi:ribosomal protein L37E